MLWIFFYGVSYTYEALVSGSTSTISIPFLANSISCKFLHLVRLFKCDSISNRAASTFSTNPKKWIGDPDWWIRIGNFLSFWDPFDFTCYFKNWIHFSRGRNDKCIRHLLNSFYSNSLWSNDQSYHPWWNSQLQKYSWIFEYGLWFLYLYTSYFFNINKIAVINFFGICHWIIFWIILFQLNIRIFLLCGLVNIIFNVTRSMLHLIKLCTRYPLVFILFTASTTYGPVLCRARYLQQRSQAVWHDRFITWIGWTWVQFLNTVLITRDTNCFDFKITCRESNSSDDKSVGRFFIWSSKSSIIRSFLLRKRAVILFFILSSSKK